MLLSGNGRHRRPRPTPKLVIAAGVTGAGVAIPLLSAVSADAAAPSTWDKVATCESGNNWSTNTGNGFYGGLQVSQHTWDSYGGTIFAERPDLASRAEQIAVADRVLKAEGPGPWAVCGEKAGLTQGGLLDSVLPADNSTDDGTAGSNSGDDQGADNAQESPSPEVVAPGRGLDGTGKGTGQDEDQRDEGSSEATPDPSGSPTQPSQSAPPEQPVEPSLDLPVEAPAREFPPQPAGGQDSGTKTPGKHAGSAKDESGGEDASGSQGKHRAPAQDDGDVVGDTLDTVVPGQRFWN